jgi:hypothetical protein
MFFVMFPMFFKVKAIVQPWNLKFQSLPNKGKSQQNQQITLVTTIDWKNNFDAKIGNAILMQSLIDY